MPNGDRLKGPSHRGPQAVIWAAFLIFCLFLLWVLDKEAGWGIWPF